MINLRLVKRGEQPRKRNPPPTGGKRFVVELGWHSTHDLDLFAILAENDGDGAKISSLDQVLSIFNMLGDDPDNVLVRDSGPFSTPCESLQHSGDAKDGIEREVDEKIIINPQRVPPGINEIMVFVSVHPSIDTTTFKHVKKGVVTVLNETGGKLCSYKLGRAFPTATIVQVGSLLEAEGGWQFVEVAKGSKGDINSILRLLSLRPTVATRSRRPQSTSVTPTPLAESGLICISKTSALTQQVQTLAMQSQLQVSTDELRQISSDATEEVLTRAQALLLTFDLARSDIATYVSWGLEPQKAYGRLVRKRLQYVQSTVLSEVTTDLQKLQELLGEVQIDSANITDSEPGFLQRMFASSPTGRRREVIKNFSRTQKAIENLIAVLRGKGRRLQNLKTRLNETIAESKQLEVDVAVFILAGEYLIRYFRGKLQEGQNEEYLQALETRYSSLATAWAEMQQSAALAELQLRHPLQLVEFIQNIVLISVPAWLTNYVALKGLVERGQTTETMRTETQRELERLREQLQDSALP